MLSAGLPINGGNGRKPGEKRSRVEREVYSPQMIRRIGLLISAKPAEIVNRGLVRSSDFVSALCPSSSRFRTTVRALFRRRMRVLLRLLRPGASAARIPNATRGQVKIPNDIKLLRKVLRLRTATHKSAVLSDAGWSSPVARQAHNLKVIGSNPIPATTDACESKPFKTPASVRMSGFFLPAANRRIAARSPRSTIASLSSSGMSVT